MTTVPEPEPELAPEPKDLFEILGVDRNASTELIKQRYSELILLYHPDKGGDTKKFKELQTAYKTLSNEHTRQLYTQSLSSTYDDLTLMYRNQVIPYESTEEDFTHGSSKEEIELKKAQFMEKFDAQRPIEEKETLQKMVSHLDSVVTDFETLQQRRADEIRDAKNFFPEPQSFDVKLFNRLFEHNKQLQTTAVEKYQDVQPKASTDLAQIGDGLITNMSSFDQLNQLNQIYEMTAGLNLDQLPPEQPQMFDPVEELMERLERERKRHDLEIEASRKETQFFDDNPLSYKNLS
jgi:curved DNA-binding protein CbpA